ncbi:glycine cleavage system protein GcvH [Rhizohabitans arisaemae]|uniref:glycine cleavage system protein GcvH n=1 Tax=Rhizohabitans arisaemae TaxID=2720610 RepID=UPI0024B083D6|nr:glycine cleavage system protein GcvH [Rhizohabitans arisaemae]
MSSIPDNLSYTKEHEWVAGLDDGDEIVVGITAFAAEALGDVVFVQLPEAGAEVSVGEPCGEVESTKSVSDIYAPVTGTITEVNQVVSDDPSLVNTDPFGDGWLFKIRVEADADDLLSAAEYAKLTESES